MKCCSEDLRPKFRVSDVFMHVETKFFKNVERTITNNWKHSSCFMSITRSVRNDIVEGYNE